MLSRCVDERFLAVYLLQAFRTYALSLGRPWSDITPNISFGLRLETTQRGDVPMTLVLPLCPTLRDLLLPESRCGYYRMGIELGDLLSTA